MTYDRQITISAGSSRNATRWPLQTLYWSELVERLQVPTRGTETLDTYLKLTKAQQDNLKDVGGFVGGIIHNGGRRKAGSIDGRDVLTLDLDHIPAGGTDDVLRRVDSLGCGYCVYSTRKHSPVAPRLRILLPLDRTTTADEYEPITRKAAELIGIDLCDPSTFEASRLMYWPSCCADSQYVYIYGDKPFLSADGMLALYTQTGQDWHDVNVWPQVPGITDSHKRLAAKQGDPTAKPGVVGAFCRTYNVLSAMDKFLPGVYVPVDNVSDRYTYAAGSTTGGAVVYDNGTFLFSHHATDPCGGRLVNAFDLVRLHVFGDKDDAAEPGTPTNRLPSYTEMCKLAVADQDVKKLLDIDRGASVLADFGSLEQQIQGDTDKKAAIGRLEDQPLTTDLIKQVLELLGISTRLNVITNQAEITGAPTSWSRENAVNNLPTFIRDFCRKAGVCGVSKDGIMDSLALLNDQARFNPVLDMLHEEPWDGQNRLPTVYHILGITDPLSQTLVKKWLWQCVAMAHNSSMKPYGADGVLTLTGEQGLGKTSFFRWLAMNSSWFIEGVSLDMKNKDSVLQATRAALAEIGELDGTLRKDLANLKAFLTSPVDSIRPPYARTTVDRPRHTSFCATVNGNEFLKDETGNRRFWTVPVKSIDLDLMRNLDTAWIRQLWAQTLTFFESNPQGFRLTQDERRQLEDVNAEHMQPLPYEEEVLNQLDFALPLEKWTEVSASQIAEQVYPRPDSRHVGRVLSKLIRTDQRVQYRGRIDNKRVYLLPMKIYSEGFRVLDSANKANRCQ